MRCILSKNWIRRVLTATIFIFLTGVSINLLAGEQKDEREYTIPGHGVLKLGVPESWVDDVSQPPDDRPPTITFTPTTGDSFSVLITAMWNLIQVKDFNKPPKIKQMMEQRGQDLLPTAEETKLELHGLRGPVCWGYYFSLTDKAPKSGEYKYLTQGSLGVGDLLISFTILTHEKESAVKKDAINMLRSSRQDTSVIQKAPASKNEIVKRYRCGMPNFKMIVVLGAAAGYDLKEIKDTREEYEILLNNYNIDAKETAEGIEVRLTAKDLWKGGEILNTLMKNAEEMESASPTQNLNETDYKIKEALLRDLKREVGILKDTFDRDVSTPANALLGHWLEIDTALELFYNDAGWLILQWPDSNDCSVFKRVKILSQTLKDRKISIEAHGEKDNSIKLEGSFSENFRRFSGLMTSGNKTKPFPFEYIYIDNKPVP